MTRLSDYATKYQTIRMERRDGILQMTFHTDGGPLQWGLLPHGEFPQAFRDVGSDPENKVVILTGTGDTVLRSPRGGGHRHAQHAGAVGSRLLGGQAPADEPARHRGADDQRHQRAGLEALRDPALVRYRAGRR
jgi:enoyl-CoA hydratase/carnithine racemase